MNWATLSTNPRITDYSFRACDALDAMTAVEEQRQRQHLIRLYNALARWSTVDDSFYRMSNWQPHRLCLMACLAKRCRRRDWAAQTHALVLDWPSRSDCDATCTCGWHSQDYHHRDAITYVVYGWWAMARACVYLQDAVQPAPPSFRPLFQPLLQAHAREAALPPSARHIEFLQSQVSTDVSKPQYGKPYNPAYLVNLLRWYDRLR